jgi:RNA polymerase sigma-70 factor (ECF subfamily)
METEPLISRCQIGDRDAFAELVQRYQNRLYNFIYRTLQNKEEAEDAVQEVFIKVFHAIRNYRPESSFTTWLFRIASNHCIDRFRRRKHSTVSLTVNAPEGEESTLEIPDTTNNPELLFFNAELQEALRSAIDSLPPKYRMVILLRHQQNLSYQEISEITGLPEGTIKAQIFRARRLLRERLKLVI